MDMADDNELVEVVEAADIAASSTNMLLQKTSSILRYWSYRK